MEIMHNPEMKSMINFNDPKLSLDNIRRWKSVEQDENV